ncbi:inorganic phosphate transporter [Rhodoluna sp. KAS3]|uniref:inorganic phosphate transporter n=1 Tax=Rhodoluna sp. KAS3 TaxID=942880 RepID=UPI00222EC0B8|nr:inorganic phosphate transporter [Rhodoluna sp. KAS3]BDS49452.1 phosphate transporter [Rhodoluna sp. KAS3]
MDPILVVGLVVGLALFFDFTNGFHDTANSSATAIATGALKPRTAVLIAALMNFAGAFLSTAVAKAISVSLISEGVNIGPEMVFAGLTGAILWNLTTWLLGLPSSSSHALFGGLIGAALVYGGFAAVNYPAVLEKLVLPSLFAPVIAGLAAFLATRVAYFLTARSQEARKATGIGTGRANFKVGQVFTSSLVALSHGTNDAQKTMGVITLVLVAAGLQSTGDHVEWWVIIGAAVAIAAGTYAGGWRIIKTMGTGLSEIKPAQGLASEVSTAATILASSNLGFALSTTQVASGGVMGAGLGRKGGQIRWTKAGHIVTGWLLTLPAAGGVGALSALLVLSGPVGLLADTVLVVAGSIAIFQISRRNRITHTNVLSEVEGASEVIASPREVRKAAAKAAAAAKKAAASAKGGK